MIKNADFWTVLLGKGSHGMLGGFVVIAFVAAFAHLLYETTHRDIASASTPVKFSWKFLLADNVGRFIASALFLCIFIRLIYEYIPAQWMMLLSAGIGFGSDKLGLIAKNIGIAATTKLGNAAASKINDQPTINAINAANK